MDMKLSSEKEYLVLDNQKLVYHLVKKLRINPNSSEYEDIISIGTIGLIKAAITFKPSKKIRFATYASKCINNEIFIYYRQTNKYANDISIDKLSKKYEEGKGINLADTIEDSASDFFEQLLHKEDFVQLVSIVLNYLRKKERLVLLYTMADLSQADIAKKLNISQPYVSRIIKKSVGKIREVVKHQVRYKEVFSMEITENEYIISFTPKHISIETCLQKLVSTEGLLDFKISCNKKRILVQVPADPESFSFIAKIIQEIDNSSMNFHPDKSILSTKTTT